MKQPAKPARHDKPRKPWKEQHQQILTCGTFIVGVAVLIWCLGTQVPMKPLPDKPRASLSMQEARR